MLDIKDLAEITARTIREHVDTVLSPLLAENEALAERIAHLEARSPERGERGEPGAPGEAGPTGAPGEPGQDGRDADPEMVRAMVADAVAAAISAMPVPERGDAGPVGAPGEPGQDGRDADPELIRTMVAEAVAAAVASLPAPERGPAGPVGEKGDKGEAGADGAGIADLLIDRDGHLVATFTDGRMKNLGLIIGRDGKDGEHGAPGSDGRNGKDLDGIEVIQDGALLQLAFTIGDERSIYELELHAGPPGRDGQDAYMGEARGLHDPEAVYRKMDVVSFNGCEWRAKQDDPGPLPGDGWMLSASKGKRGDRGDPGPAGKSAPAIVASYIDTAALKHVITLEDGTELKADLTEFAHTLSR